MLITYCVRGTRTQPLICVVREVFSRLHFRRRRRTFASLSGAWLRFASLWRTNARGDLCVVGVHYSSVWWGVIIFHRSSLKRAERLLKVCQLKSVKFYFGLSMVRHCPWKMCATPRACIKPVCFARRPLCHKVNLPSWQCSSAAVLPQSKSTELCSSVAVLPQSKSTELCSSAAFLPQSKSTELCSSVAVVPQSKSTEIWRSSAPFHHDLWYLRHWNQQTEFILSKRSAQKSNLRSLIPQAEKTCR